MDKKLTRLEMESDLFGGGVGRFFEQPFLAVTYVLTWQLGQAVY